MGYTRRFFRVLALIWVGILLHIPVYAGPYTDDLSNCILESTTPEEQMEFVKWVFSTRSLYSKANKTRPEISQEQINAGNEQTANLFMRVMTRSCKEKAVKAIKFESEFVLQTTLSLLEQVAGPDILTTLDIVAVTALVEKYIDVEKLRSTLGIEW